jgi:hypothetical protein
MILAFVKYRGAGGPKEELTNIHDWINIARVSSYTLSGSTVANMRSSATKSLI